MEQRKVGGELKHNFISCSFIKILVNISDPFEKYTHNFPLSFSLSFACIKTDFGFCELYTMFGAVITNPPKKIILSTCYMMFVLLPFYSLKRGDKNSLNYLSCILMSRVKMKMNRRVRGKVVASLVIHIICEMRENIVVQHACENVKIILECYNF
jgi:hypothetical protein